MKFKSIKLYINSEFELLKFNRAHSILLNYLTNFIDNVLVQTILNNELEIYIVDKLDENIAGSSIYEDDKYIIKLLMKPFEDLLISNLIKCKEDKKFEEKIELYRKNLIYHELLHIDISKREDGIELRNCKLTDAKNYKELLQLIIDSMLHEYIATYESYLVFPSIYHVPNVNDYLLSLKDMNSYLRLKYLSYIFGYEHSKYNNINMFSDIYNPFLDIRAALSKQEILIYEIIGKMLLGYANSKSINVVRSKITPQVSDYLKNYGKIIMN